MAAGIPQRLLNNRYRYRLQKIQRELRAAGVPAFYKHYQVFANQTNRSDRPEFNIRFRTLRASNGEVAGLLIVSINNPTTGETEHFGAHEHEKGIARIKELFGNPPIVNIPAPLPAHIPDFTVQNEGTIYVLYAQTDAARAWVNEHLPTDRTTWGGNGTVIEHRYIADIIDGIRASGLEVR